MSSILKALKKLETGELRQFREAETESAQNSEIFYDPRKSDIKKTIRHQARERQILKMLVSVAALIFVVFGGLWLFLSRKPPQVQTLFSDAVSVKENSASKSRNVAISEKTGESIPPAQKKAVDQKEDKALISSQKIPVPEVKPEPEKSAISSEKRISLPEPAVKNISDPEKTEKSPPNLVSAVKTEVEKAVRLPEKIAPVSASPATRTPEPENFPQHVAAAVKPEVEKPVRLPEKTSPRTESSVKKSSDPEKTEKSPPNFVSGVKSEVEKAVRPPEKTDTASKLSVSKTSEPKKDMEPSARTATKPERSKEIEDPRLKLQALVWSGDPEKRLAVVNDRIVKTGGLVTDTITVTHIGSDYITVREGNKEWEVKFKIK